MKLNNVAFILFGFFLLGQSLDGQVNQEKLFPELEGDALLEEVFDQFKADILFFDYGTTRDTLFREVYAVNDSLECIYSGHKLYMNPLLDPTTTVYMNGSKDGINTEHVYPRSKGASFGNAKSDMHHLFPARAMVNEERSNFPFGDIDDNQATKWFWQDQALLVKPSEDLDKYSEWKWQVFEPRESVKGNIARAVMYFYTMYKTQSDVEDPDFFWDMLPEMCEWHFADPVDSAEYARTNLIAKWQEHPNPFVLDCSIASRSYCADIMDDACELAVPTEDIASMENRLEITYDNGFQEVRILNSRQFKGITELQIYDMQGSLVIRDLQNLSTLPSISVRSLSNGTYVLKVANRDLVSSAIFVKQ